MLPFEEDLPGTHRTLRCCSVLRVLCVQHGRRTPPGVSHIDQSVRRPPKSSDFPRTTRFLATRHVGPMARATARGQRLVQRDEEKSVARRCRTWSETSGRTRSKTSRKVGGVEDYRTQPRISLSMNWLNGKYRKQQKCVHLQTYGFSPPNLCSGTLSIMILRNIEPQ